VPFACQILRGTVRTDHGCDQGFNTNWPQVNATIVAKRPELPKLRASANAADTSDEERDPIWIKGVYLGPPPM
jgi:hypothetical protein